MTLSSETRAKVVEAMARADHAFIAGPGKNLHEALLDAALPLIADYLGQRQSAHREMLGINANWPDAQLKFDDAIRAIRALAGEAGG